MAQDKHQRAKERWSDATDHMREQHSRMLDDMRFSNPADPQQWDPKARELRKGRPCLTFDRTNQFIAQVVHIQATQTASIRKVASAAPFQVRSASRRCESCVTENTKTRSKNNSTQPTLPLSLAPRLRRRE